jgi:hypothetical protein
MAVVFAQMLTHEEPQRQNQIDHLFPSIKEAESTVEKAIQVFP